MDGDKIGLLHRDVATEYRSNASALSSRLGTSHTSSQTAGSADKTERASISYTGAIPFAGVRLGSLMRMNFPFSPSELSSKDRTK
jgi:hypothetical protein